MEFTSDTELKAHLIATDAHFRTLSTEHATYSRLLSELENKSHLTAEEEIEEHRLSLQREVQASGRSYQMKAVLGKPDQALLDYAAAIHPDLVVIGAPRPRGTPGLRSRMRVDKLAGALGSPLLVIPHPR